MISANTLINELDQVRLNEIKIKYNKFKYVHNLHKWFKTHLKYNKQLNLHNSKPKNIIDLGTGAGIFPYIAKQFNHAASATDFAVNKHKNMQLSLAKGVFFNEFTEFLNINVIPWKIYPNKPSPNISINRKFDLIFASHLTWFLTTGDKWTLDEWNFFLFDLKQHLTDDGEIWLRFNKPFKRYGYGLYFNNFEVIDNTLVCIKKQMLI